MKGDLYLFGLTANAMSELFPFPRIDFQLDGVDASAKRHEVDGTILFRIQFRDGRPALTIAKMASGKHKMWTSVPQGRHEEAEKCGFEIEKILKGK